jgi:uncharacterized protein (DUF2336 family)
VTAADQVEQIGRRVRRSDRAEREQLLAALAELADGGGLDASPRAQVLVGEILTGAADGADPELRERVAAWAARGRCMPRPLAAALALDGIGVAGPVIRRSATLETEDLLRLVGEGDAERQIAVSRRAALQPAVIEAVLEQGEPAALTALAANPQAPLAPEHLDLLVGMAKRLPSLRAPLARRAELTRGLAAALAPHCGGAVRLTLRARFGLLEAARALSPPEGCERRLVAKLAAAGRLSPGYALRVLREGRLALFEHALAALTDKPHQQVREAFDAPEPGPLADACEAAGMDRSVTPLVLSLVRALNEGRPGDAVPLRPAKVRSKSPRTRARSGATSRKPAPRRAAK